MIQYIIRRILIAIPLLLAVLLATFFLVDLLPGDAVEIRFSRQATQEQIDAVKTKWGLDRSLPEQFVTYVGNVVQGDFGTDFSYNSISDELKMKGAATLELAVVAMFFALIGGVTIGILTSLRPRSWLDMAGLVGALAGVSIPIFMLGIFATDLVGVGGFFAKNLSWFDGLPGSGRLPSTYNTKSLTEPSGTTGLYLIDSLFYYGDPQFFKDAFLHVITPAIVLASVPMALITRITRASMGEAMLQDYIRTARAKGLSTRQVVLRHALKNAAIPIFTTSGTQFAYLLAGAVLTETVFQWPGLGTYITHAIINLEGPKLQASILVIGAVFVFMNLIVDVSYALIDPRIRKPGV